MIYVVYNVHIALGLQMIVIFTCIQSDRRSQFVRGHDRPVPKIRRVQRVQRDQQVSRHDHRLRVQAGQSAVFSRELLVRV